MEEIHFLSLLYLDIIYDSYSAHRQDLYNGLPDRSAVAKLVLNYVVHIVLKRMFGFILS
jgi:hypothetical protein